MTKPDQIQSDASALLHFNPKWFTIGLLPLEFFEEQVEKYRKVWRYQEEEDDVFGENPDPQVGEDSFWASLEHHRYAAFQTVLTTRDTLSDTDLEHYIELCQADEDQGMGLSALINLLSWQGLRDEQYERIIGHPAFSHPVTQKIIWRNKMSQELLEDEISDEAFSEMLERKDPVFERELVESESLSPHQMEILAEKGISRAVRNMAKSKLRRRK